MTQFAVVCHFAQEIVVQHATRTRRYGGAVHEIGIAYVIKVLSLQKSVYLNQLSQVYLTGGALGRFVGPAFSGFFTFPF